MNPIDYFVLAGLVVAISCIAAWMIRRKKQGKSGCGCCKYRDNCAAAANRK